MVCLLLLFNPKGIFAYVQRKLKKLLIRALQALAAQLYYSGACD